MSYLVYCYRLLNTFSRHFSLQIPLIQEYEKTQCDLKISKRNSEARARLAHLSQQWAELWQTNIED